jgi:hypothetical protein
MNCSYGSYQGTALAVPTSIGNAGALVPEAYNVVQPSYSRIVTSMIAFALLIVSASSVASATTFTGTVHNGTTGKLAAGVDVVLISLQGEMQTVANTKTDAQGRYQLNFTPAGQMPMLVRAIYKNMFFHGMLPPGTTSADVQIYEPSPSITTVAFPTRLVVCRPNGSTLLIDDIYSVQNQSSPPFAYFKTDGNFEFQTADGADKIQVSVEGPEHVMPTVQGTIDRGKNRYAIAYAFRPGDSEVHLAYEVPYSGNKTVLHLDSSYAVGRIMLIAPPSVSLSAAGFQPGGTEQGMAVYARDTVAAGTVIDASVSGTAPPPDNADQQGAADPSAGGRDAGAAVAAVPPRLDTLKWILLAGFGSLFLLGAAFLMRRPVPAGIAVGAAPQQSVAPRETAHQSAPVSAAPIVAPSESLGAVDREVGASLDQLKDTLFRLELRHQAGTISEQEYAEQRARAEKILRDLVRG